MKRTTPDETAADRTAEPDGVAPRAPGDGVDHRSADGGQRTGSGSRRSLAVVAVAGLAILGLAGCGDDEANDAGGSGSSVAGGRDRATVQLLTHDSFNVSEDVLAGFTDRTGIEVEILRSGDAVGMVNRAILTAGNPEADVLFGIDQNLLGAARVAELFERYEPPELTELDQSVVVDPTYGVTPVDRGDVCVNYDREWFAAEGVAVPVTLEDLADPEYRGLLAVQNPATSTPGLSFLSATVAVFGDPEAGGEADVDGGPHDDFASYWEALVANDVAVADGWEDAYYGQFSGGAGEGDRPLVVSYATSPPVEVIYSEAYEATGELPDEAPTGVLADTCIAQTEYAGVLRGTDQPEAARQLIDFLIGEELQADVPLTMFVEPVREGVALPEVFTRFSERPEAVIEADPELIEAHRDRWVTTWTETVLR